MLLIYLCMNKRGFYFNVVKQIFKNPTAHVCRMTSLKFKVSKRYIWILYIDLYMYICISWYVLNANSKKKTKKKCLQIHTSSPQPSQVHTPLPKTHQRPPLRPPPPSLCLFLEVTLLPQPSYGAPHGGCRWWGGICNNPIEREARPS